ncbi:MAG: RNA-guided endonuclease TnpB family protein, partial [Microcystaceae cyanobacterium]
MAKSTTPSFVTELPLVVDSHSEKELLSRFQAGRQLYNALLSEAMTRMNLVRNSRAYQEAKKIPKTEQKKRQKAFKEARRADRYSDYDLQAYATVVSNQSHWIAKKLDSNTQQKLATRAFKASEKVMFSQAKRVRFKVSSRFRSLEGKTNKQGIRWSNNQFVWGKLRLKAIIDPLNIVTQHGLN